MKTFSIMHSKTIKSIPWDMIKPHEAQAFKNHYQSLKRLNERGGLGVTEVLAVLKDEPWKLIEKDSAEALLSKMVKDYEESLKNTVSFDGCITQEQASNIQRHTFEKEHTAYLRSLRLEIPPAPIEPFEVVHVEGWNQCIDFILAGKELPKLEVNGESVEETVRRNCKGSGEFLVLSDGGPNAEMLTVDCPKCFGTGEPQPNLNDTDRINFIESECLDVCAVQTSEESFHWIFKQHHMGEKDPRVIHQSFTEDLRKSIDDCYMVNNKKL